jgi:hypothetical protein
VNDQPIIDRLEAAAEEARRYGWRTGRTGLVPTLREAAQRIKELEGERDAMDNSLGDVYEFIRRESLWDRFLAEDPNKIDHTAVARAEAAEQREGELRDALERIIRQPDGHRDIARAALAGGDRA